MILKKQQKYILNKLSQIREAIWKLQEKFEDRRLYRNTCQWQRSEGGYVYPGILADTIAPPDGTVVLPGIGFREDRNTGIYRTPAGTIGISVNNTLICEVGAASIFLPVIRAGINQAAAGAAANELWHDTTDNTIKIGV